MIRLNIFSVTTSIYFLVREKLENVDKYKYKN